MCGDALAILPDRIADSTVDNLFVNHPEPPQQTGGWEMDFRFDFFLYNVDM
jgi:hypothetical protein